MLSRDFVIAVGGEGKRLKNYFSKIGFKQPKIFFEIDEKPIIKHLIDMGLNCNFRKIYLLTSHNKKELEQFLKKNYPDNKKLTLVYEGAKGKKYGVPYLLNSIRDSLSESFVYSDGNILYPEDLLEGMKFFEFGKEQLIAAAVTEKNIAPTHSMFGLSNDVIKTVKARFFNNVNDPDYKNLELYCSLGLMIFDAKIFEAVDGFSMTLDLDNVVEQAFEKNKNSVGIVKFKGNWHALHTQDDIDRLN